MIQVKKTTITSSQILNIMTTPIEVLSAPASGYANNILGISMDMVYSGTAYTGSTSAYMKFFSQSGSTTSATTANIVWQDTFKLYTYNNNIKQAINKAIVGSSTVFTTTSAFYMGNSAAPALGNSDIDIYVVYEKKLIE
jgi:hypothetical protein